MAAEVVDKLKFRGGRLGYVKLSDGSMVVLRVAVIDARVREETSPFGVEFEVDATGGVSIYPSEKSIKEIENKPVLEPRRAVGEGWVRVDIVDKMPAYEEVIYDDGKIGAYVIRVEIEPIMVSKNTMFKSIRGQPLYVVRWVPKVTWSKLEEKSKRGEEKVGSEVHGL